MSVVRRKPSVQQEGFRIGVDIGGTFTDLVVLDERAGEVRTLKVASTPNDPSQAVLTGVRRLHDEFGIDLSQVTQFTHATTVACNTILEGTGARTGLLVTDGFRDVLQIQRHKRYRLFDLAYKKIAPLVPRHLIHGIPERIDAAGAVVRALDEEAVATAVETLRREGIEALAICFLFSFRNAAHEQRAAEIARKILPNAFVTISSDVLPQYREYERTSTTSINGLLGPRMSRYLGNMNGSLEDNGISAPLHLMQSNGGVLHWQEASRMPCRIVESGPAAGVIAAAHFGAVAGRQQLIAFDMGGTTAKAGLVENGNVRQSDGQEVGAGINISRVLQGGGYYIGAPTVDLAEVGAGGGSIAWLDAAGMLKVGPRSAGADPGPIAYGLGGESVTVTDANLLLGRIPADHFLGGEMQLDVERARRVVEETIAKPLGTSVEDACAAIIEVANASMLKMLRIVTVEKGLDPADFTLVAFGGNGPVFGIELADDLGMREVIIPPAPGLLSAQGLLAADLRYDFRQTFVGAVASADLAEIEARFTALEAQGRNALQSHGIGDAAIVATRNADMRYRRQAYELNVPLPLGALSAATLPALVESFHQAHERLYGRRDAVGAVEIVNLCVALTGNVRRPEYREIATGNGSAAHASKGTRNVFFANRGSFDCVRYERPQLRAGDSLQGPAIVEAADSTTLLPPDWSLRCDRIGNLFATRSG
jgi:N-methylhydantoinase A